MVRYRTETSNHKRKDRLAENAFSSQAPKDRSLYEDASLSVIQESMYQDLSQYHSSVSPGREERKDYKQEPKIQNSFSNDCFVPFR